MRGQIIKTGMTGSVVVDLGNGFAEFHADNGVRFTIHKTEFVADAATPDQAKAARERVAHWPVANFVLVVDTDSRGRKSLRVFAIATPDVSARSDLN